MSNRKHHEFMYNLERCYKLVQQSSTKGITAIKIAEKMDKHRTTVHGYLNTLEHRGQVECNHGTWYAKSGDQMINPMEKEIIIELPIPENQVPLLVQLEAVAKIGDKANLSEDANIYKIFLEKLNETRTIRIRGKNVNDLDLEKLGNMIKEANKKSSKLNLRGLFKNLKK